MVPLEHAKACPSRGEYRKEKEGERNTVKEQGKSHHLVRTFQERQEMMVVIDREGE